jgi:hypothetical protein
VLPECIPEGQPDAQDPPRAPRVGAHPAERVRLLDRGTFKEHVAMGLDLLRNNRIRGEKVVVTVRMKRHLSWTSQEMIKYFGIRVPRRTDNIIQGLASRH